MKRLAITLIAATVGLVTAATLLPSCAATGTTRSARLLTMAAEEAGFIDSLDERLTRQLNIADMQIQTRQKAEALKTLRLAAATLKVQDQAPEPPRDPARKPAAFDDFRRIAGWTSIAELSHQAGDKPFALDAYLNAVESLNSVNPVESRAEYVLSLSQICSELKGKTEAGRLLVKGGEWAAAIKEPRTRRFALSTFANALVANDDFEAARTVMKNEPDARWRSDVFSAIAQNTAARESGARTDSGYAHRSMSEPAPLAAAAAKETDRPLSAFNRDVRYLNNFRQEAIQRGVMPH